MKGALFIFRLIFVITTASVSYQISMATMETAPFSLINIGSIVTGALVGVSIIWIEIQYANRFIVIIFTVILGLLIGFIASNLFLQALFLIPHIQLIKQRLPIIQFRQLQEAVQVGITFFFCYMAIAILIRTRNRFKLLIPFIDLNRESTEKYLVIDSSIIIDGKILNICDTKILQGTFTIPRFVLHELQTLADSADRKKRERGRRGIDILGELQKKLASKIHFDLEMFPQIREVDDKLIALTQRLSGILVTNDYNLKKIAELQNIDVINLNAVANALRPSVLPGDLLHIHILKYGEEAGQGVGYLEDGTVVIIENGAKYMGKMVEIVITNVLQTNMGRMVFAKPNEEK